MVHQLLLRCHLDIRGEQHAAAMAVQPKHHSCVVGGGECAARRRPENFKADLRIERDLSAARDGFDRHMQIVQMFQHLLGRHVPARLIAEDGANHHAIGPVLIRHIRRRGEMIEIRMAKQDRLHMTASPAAKVRVQALAQRVADGIGPIVNQQRSSVREFDDAHLSRADREQRDARFPISRSP